MKKIKIVAIIGKSGAGKDFCLHKFCSNNDMVHEIVSCTTRPARWHEEDGKNYHFLTEDQFLSEQFLESCTFRDWKYGTRYKDLDEDKINIGVFNLSGVEQLLNNPKLDLVIIHVIADDKIRIMRQFLRDPNSDIEEIIRRYYADKEDFSEKRINNIQKQVSVFTIVNDIDYNEDKQLKQLQKRFDIIIDKVKKTFGIIDYSGQR